MRHFIRKLWLSAHVVTWVIFFIVLMSDTGNAFDVGKYLWGSVISAVVLTMVYRGTVEWAHWLTKDLTWVK